MKHSMLHIFGCLIPISLVFILPAFGFDSGTTFTVFIILMFACHFFMMGGHAHGEDGNGSAANHDVRKTPTKGGEQ